MTCRDWEERIALHAGGDLPAAEASALEAHLAVCEGCRGIAEAYGSDLKLLREAHREPIDPAHYAAVRARVLAELRQERWPVWRWIWVCSLVAAAASVVMLLWPRPVETPERIRMAVNPPAGPQIEMGRPVEATRPMHPRRTARLVKRDLTAPVTAAVSEPEKRAVEPLVIKLLTDDPNVIIYWIADSKGD